jgi:PAS domain S-box-containing protein
LAVAAVAVRGDAEPLGVVDLAGEWRAFAGDSPAGPSPELDDSRWDRVELPASWRQLGLSGLEGLVWFRRQVTLPPEWGEMAPSGLSVLIGAASFGAYELYAGGQLIGPLASERAPGPQVFRLPGSAFTSGGRLQLALAFHRVAWPRDRLTGAGGPVGERVVLGDHETLLAEAEAIRLDERRSRMPAAILAALLAAIGLYHLQLFALRRASLDYLWFGLLALDFAALTWVGEDLVLAEGLRRRLFAVLGHLGMALLIRFLWRILSRPLGPLVRAYQVSQLLIAALVALAPELSWIAVTQVPRWLWGLPLVFEASRLLVGEARRGRREARALFPGGAAILLAVTAEPVLQMRGVEPALPLPGLAFLLLAASMAIWVSKRFTRAHRELDQFRFELEQMVEERTDELASAHRRLKAGVAERELVEEAMRMLERAVEQSIDGIAVTDLAGSTQFLNESWARIHGYEVFEVLGYDLTLFHTPEQMQDQVFPLMKRVRERGVFQGEVWHRRKDGAEFPTWMSVTRLQDADDEPVGMVAIARDVTDRRRSAEEQLRLEAKAQQAEKLESLAKLAAGIAHDYNNLLTGVLGNASLALRELESGSPARGKLRQIESAGERAATLSDQLLAYAGEDQLALRTVEINDLVTGMRPELQEVVPGRVELEFHLKDGLPPIEVDPAQLRQVILNLLRNACESVGDERGVVTLRTSKVWADRSFFEGAFLDEGQPAGDYTILDVSDSGCGVDEEMRVRLFDPFFSTKGPGRGLGLATALGIVRAHRGAIKVFSRVGRGTTVEVLLPASTRRLEAVPEVEDLERWKGRGKILVVDDELLVREVAKDILEQHDFEVLTAGDGREAVEVYRQHGEVIRAVLLDLTMPGMGGEQASREIRNLDPRAVVLLMSGFSIKRVEGEGLAGFLHKPFRPDDLVRKIKEVLEGW